MECIIDRRSCNGTGCWMRLSSTLGMPIYAGAVMALAVGCGAKEETKSVQETSAVSETARTEGTTAHTEETEKAPEAEKKESEVQASHAADETARSPSMAGFVLTGENGGPNIVFGMRDGKLAVLGINY